MALEVKRIYDEPRPKDGQRILVDRVWPRGVSKSRAQLDEWIKEVAPSGELRKWFGHDPEKWKEFKRRYFRELDAKPGLVDELRRRAAKSRVTLLYGAKDREHNNAIALEEYLQHRARH